MGQTVGSTEDLLVSIVACAVGTTKPSILILDDIETIFGYEYDTSAKSMADPGGGGNNSREPHVTARVRAILFCLLDQLRNATNGDGRTLLICTSKINLGKSIDRFDAIFTLSSPGENEREVIISQHVDLFENRGILSSTTSSTELESMMLNLVECTSGLSYAELAQYCRQAVLVSHEQYQNSSQPNDNLKIVFLKALKQELQLSMPESLRRGINADFVDMKVMSAKDLQEISSVTEGSPVSLPLYGKSAEIAWQELLRTIVIPICQVGALDTLLHQQGGRGGKIFAGGVILTGDPGCGKSALAYHAAAVASTMNPSVKLVDVSCTSLISKEVGSSERSMHRLFEAARAAAPCILLMDGIENVAAVRGNDNTTEGTMDRVISTLLTELDGVDSEQFSQENPACLAIIGITHNSSWIDPALRRPGRLGSVIEVGRPEHEARKNIVLRELKESNYVHDITIIDNSYHGLESLAEFVAAETEGLTGAVIIAVCNEAKVFSSRAWREDMTGQDVQLKPGHVLAAIKSRRAGVR
jgi:SpoVK/Ycf46/Vps4 family AAA+-type ATPase